MGVHGGAEETWHAGLGLAGRQGLSSGKDGAGAAKSGAREAAFGCAMRWMMGQGGMGWPGRAGQGRIGIDGEGQNGSR